MIKVLGKAYINPKEASQRYGFSTHWLQRKRSNNEQPKYVKLEGRGKVYYPLDDTDKWFNENIREFG